MSAAKKHSSSSFSSAWLLGPGRPVLIMLLLIGLCAGGMFAAYRKLRPKILASPEYQVGPEQVEITPLPEWIHSDIRAEAFRDPALDGPLSLLDDDLVVRVKKAFAERPWVEKVISVHKFTPSTPGAISVKVELGYRKPACMVEVPGGVLAVDGEGVLLPSQENFTSLEVKKYPLLVRMDRLPVAPAGQRWSDSRVIGAAEIAAALGPAWAHLGLARIEPLADDPAAAVAGGDSHRRSQEPVFALFTRGGTRILWGYAPGANVLDEIPAAEKVARLVQYHSANDTLDGPRGKQRTRRPHNASRCGDAKRNVTALR